MSQEDQNFSVWGFIKGFGKLLIGLLLLLQGVVGLFVMLMIVGLFVSATQQGAGSMSAANVPDNSALLFNPQGVLVEQSEERDPLEEAIEEAYGANSETQIESGDLIRALRRAAKDDRITSVVLDLGGLFVPQSSASKLHEIGAALDAVKAADKEIIAVGDAYTQEQYILAAHADKIYLNSFGDVFLLGYANYGVYLKSFFDKIKATSHVFRVGTYKAAVEPFLRDDMSPEAEEANLAYLNVLWDEYAAATEKARGLPAGAIKSYADGISARIAENGGDLAKSALAAKLVDELKSRREQLALLEEKYGKDDDDDVFKHVSLKSYLANIGDAYVRADGTLADSGKDGAIAIVTAAGTIVDGEAPDGAAAGGDTIADYLKQAREDEDVKAVVLRVDSPGGSSFASEIIRDEVVALKKAGKPVVVSMGSLAASGGYWIAAPADRIFAAPTTITGSIGIFAFFTTFENTAAEFGVYTDGVGTSPLSSILATGIGPLPAEAGDLIQRSTEHGYEEFLRIVGEGRKLDRDYVDSIAQGRVWIGAKAKELQLVDEIGGLDEAIAHAASLAKLNDYKVTVIEGEADSPFSRFFGVTAATAMKAFGVDKATAKARSSATVKAIGRLEKAAAFMGRFNDPSALYARCVACEF